MTKPSLTYDAILLACAGLVGAAGCAKSERNRMAPEPAVTATPVSAPGNVPPSAAASGAESTTTATAAPPRTMAPVAAPSGSTAPSKGGSAACGAGGCSADMKKPR